MNEKMFSNEIIETAKSKLKEVIENNNSKFVRFDDLGCEIFFSYEYNRQFCISILQAVYEKIGTDGDTFYSRLHYMYLPSIKKYTVISQSQLEKL
jgi:hypothetical protein